MQASYLFHPIQKGRSRSKLAQAQSEVWWLSAIQGSARDDPETVVEYLTYLRWPGGKTLKDVETSRI
jgi:hypothetical protein